MYAETADIEMVMVNGKIVKSDGKLMFDDKRLQGLNNQLMESRMRIFGSGQFRAVEVERGPQPDKFFL
jgi:hypothetical protein